MPKDELREHATSSTDFYELLGVTFETSQRDLDRAWRRTALKYHPDKVGPDLVAKEKFQLAQIGYDLLSDPASKAIYDNARTARQQRQRQNELFEGRRRQMKDDLEARERGIKRPRDDGVTSDNVSGYGPSEEEKLELELRRLAEDGKRRRKEREENLRNDLEREKKEKEEATVKNEAQMREEADLAIKRQQRQSDVPELDRTIKVRWPTDHVTAGDVTISTLKEMFTVFGKVENISMLSAKLMRPCKDKAEGKKCKKQQMMTCMITFESIVGAHAAVEEFPSCDQTDPLWKVFDSVTWANNKEPDILNDMNGRHDTPVKFTNGVSASPSTPYTPQRQTPNESKATPFMPGQSNSRAKAREELLHEMAKANDGIDGLRKKPSFASFSSAAAKTPSASPFAKSAMGMNSPSLEELTMIRLRKLEQKRLAVDIERRETAEG